MDGTASPGRATRRVGVSALTALALAGCASLPPATPARVAKAPTAYETAKSFAAPVAGWPADGWWKRYGDPQLDALMDEALAGSPTLAQAQARVVTARAATAVAAAQLLPEITGQGQVQEQKQTYAYLFPKAFLPLGYQDYGQVTLNLNWELDFWGKNRAAVRAAASDARAAAADAAEARLVLTTDIASQYATLARLYADRDVAVQAERVREDTANLTAQRVANGLDTQAELKQAEAGSPAARANIAAIDEQIAQTRDALAALLGAGPDRGLALARPKAARLAAFGLPTDLRIGLIGRRPDVIAARWRAEAATHRIKQAKAAFYPDINLSGFFGQRCCTWISCSPPRGGAGQHRIPTSPYRSSRPDASAGPCAALRRIADAPGSATYDGTVAEAPARGRRRQRRRAGLGQQLAEVARSPGFL